MYSSQDARHNHLLLLLHVGRHVHRHYGGSIVRIPEVKEGQVFWGVISAGRREFAAETNTHMGISDYSRIGLETRGITGMGIVQGEDGGGRERDGGDS